MKDCSGGDFFDELDAVLAGLLRAVERGVRGFKDNFGPVVPAGIVCDTDTHRDFHGRCGGRCSLLADRHFERMLASVQHETHLGDGIPHGLDKRLNFLRRSAVEYERELVAAIAECPTTAFYAQ